MSTHRTMTTTRKTRSGRPTKAVVGSHRPEEEVFGKAYDPRIVRRIWSFVKPYQGRIFISVAAVLVFTLTQLAIPLIIRYAIDNGMAAGQLDRSVLAWAVGAFAVTILVNYARQLCAGKSSSARSPRTCCPTCAAPCSRTCSACR